MIFADLPATIKNLSSVGGALRSLGNINIGTMPLDTSYITYYQKAIKGLTAEQAAYVLATKGANAAQIEEIMTTETATMAKGTYTQADIQAAIAKQGLTSTVTVLSAAQQTELINSGLLTSEKLSEIAATLGLETAENGALVAKEALTAAMVSEKLASIGIVGAQQTQIMSILGLTAAEKGNVTVTNLLTGAWNKLKAAIAAHPIGAMIVAMAVLVAVAVKVKNALDDASKDRVEKINEARRAAAEAVTEAKSKLQEIQSELTEVEKKLSNINSEISELTGKPSINLIDKQQIEKLAAAKQLLLEQQSLLKLQERTQAQALASAARVYLTTKVGEENKYSFYNGGIHASPATGDYKSLYEGAMMSMQTNMRNYIKMLQKNDYDHIIDEYSQLQNASTYALISDINSALSNMQNADGTIVAGYEKIYNQYSDYLHNLQAMVDPSNFWGLIDSFNISKVDIGGMYEDIMQTVYKGTYNIDNVNKQFINALAEKGVNKDTIDYIFKLKQEQFKDYLELIDNKYPEVKKSPSSQSSGIGSSSIDLNLLKGTFDPKRQDFDEEGYNAALAKAAAVKKAIDSYSHPDDFEYLTRLSDGISRLNTYLDEEYTKTNNWSIALENSLQRIKSDTVTEQTASQKQQEIRKHLLDYAQKNPIEFELLATYDSNFTTLDKYINAELKKTDDYKVAVGNAITRITEEMQQMGFTAGVSFVIDISKATDELGKFNTAIKESNTETGLSSDSIQALTERYQNLFAFDASKLFEKTATGVRLNTQELNKLESQYIRLQKQKNDIWLKNLTDQYSSLQEKLEKETDAQKRANLLTQKSSLYKQIQEAANLATMYDGLTSAYKKWKDAQNSGEAGDTYDTIRDSLEDIQELYEKGLVGTNEFRTYVDMLSSADLSSASVDKVVEAWKKLGTTIKGTNYSIKDFLADDEQGVNNFLNAVSQLNKEWASQDANGKWNINFGVGNDTEIANALGTTEEFVQDMLQKLKDYGFEIKIDTDYSALDTLQSEAEAANQKLIDLGKTTVTFDFSGSNLQLVNQQISKAKSMLEQFKKADGTIDLSVEGAKEAQSILATLIYQKQLLDESTILKVDTSNADDEVVNIIKKLQDFKASYNEVEVEAAVGADTTEAKQQCNTLFAEIKNMNPEIIATLGLDTTRWGTLISSINAITPEMMIKIGLDSSLIEDYESAEHTTNGTVIWENNIDAVTAWAGINHTSKGTVEWTNDTTDVKTYFTAEGKIKWTGNTQALGTAHVQGSAFKQGNWGIEDNGTALGGELGTELLVRDGKFYTIGDKSAEFFNYRKGDIIFNADQTEQIFKYGKILSGKRRGNVYAEGSAFSSGNGSFYISSSSNDVGKDNGSSDSSSSSSPSSSADDFEETFDWIEIAIDRIERAITRLDTKAKSSYRSWKSRISNLSSEMSKVTEEINLQEKAYDRYIKEANSVGLSESYAKLVREGKIDISTITDEDLADKIKNFQKYYEKALDCKDAIDKLNESLGELAKTAFDDTQTWWEQVIGIVDHEKSMLEEFVDQSEERGYITSTKYYTALIERESNMIDQYKQERDGLLAKLQEGLESGAIERNSEAFFEMVTAINEVNLSIEEANTEILKYQKNIREINWEVFDLIQTKISKITDEANFLIDLMENSELFDDKGQLTDTGMATMGLRGQNYNVYMAQADKYAKEILDLDKQIANDPYNQDLIDRRQDLIKLQQESITNAESEKQAIKDLVAEGIEKELESLKDLIDEYEDSLSTQKDMYDYQKKVKKQTKEITKLQKQLAAYTGDLSEETKAKVQKLEVSLADAQENLAETQYDHFISDSKKMLDDLYDEYEEILNKRLDDLDALIADMIEEINTNSGSINSTIETQAGNVGYTISEEMSNIWKSNTGVNGVLTTYGDKFDITLTSVNSVLGTIDQNVANMIIALNKIAGTNITAASDSNALNSTQAQATKKEPPKPATTTPKNNTSAKTIKVGGKINAKGAKIYGYAGGTGYTQYFSYDPIYTVLKEQNGYLLVRWHKLSSGETGWFKKSDVTAYKKGIRSVPYGQNAWTQEGGISEAIVRPSDGAILTPLKRKDMVLNGTATSNIWDMANDPAKFIAENLGVGELGGVINTNNSFGNTEVNFDNIQFTLPNVTNYDEFVTAMQTDPKIERIVRAMTTDRLFGGSRQKKHRV